MKNQLMKAAVAAGLVITLATGCAVDTVGVAVQPQRPVYVRPAAPYSNYVWVDGNWVWANGNYRWREGYWAAPRRGRAYAPGYWTQTRRGYVWNRGRWK